MLNFLSLSQLRIWPHREIPNGMKKSESLSLASDPTKVSSRYDVVDADPG